MILGRPRHWTGDRRLLQLTLIKSELIGAMVSSLAPPGALCSVAVKFDPAALGAATLNPFVGCLKRGYPARCDHALRNRVWAGVDQQESRIIGLIQERRHSRRPFGKSPTKLALLFDLIGCS